MNVSLHILCFNESGILPYALRHYATFCTRMVMHDMGSSDGSQEIAKSFGAEVVQHDGKSEFNDMQNKHIKQESWKGETADWVIQADTDELIYFPSGAKACLEAYSQQRLPIVKPYGFEMFSDEYPTGSGQIYDYVKNGSRDDRWYAKPILFSPRLVKSVEFSTGAHTVEAVLHNGRKVTNPIRPSNPSCFLLHYHHIGGVNLIAQRYAENQKRQSAMNKKMGWGNQEDPMKHAMDKRAAITAGLGRVVL